MESLNQIFRTVRDAVARDDVNVLVNYLDAGGCIKACTHYKFWYLVHTAAEKGSIKCMLVLLDRGVDVDTVDYGEWTPLIHAASRGHFEMVNLLLNRGADINASGYYGETALYLAVSGGRIECVRFLLERGANRDIANIQGFKPIDICDRMNNQEIAEQMRRLLNGGR